jgi:hypothetical protein
MERSAAACMVAPKDPVAETNALKHGMFTKEAIEARRQVRALVRQSRKFMQEIE